MRPRTMKLLQEQKQVPFIEVRRLLYSYNIRGEQLADVLRMSPSAARVRLKNPGKLTLNELQMICDSGIPAFRILEAINLEPKVI